MEINVIDEKNLEKLKAINNKYVEEIVEKYVKLCRPKKVTVLDDSKEKFGKDTVSPFELE